MVENGRFFAVSARCELERSAQVRSRGLFLRYDGDERFRRAVINARQQAQHAPQFGIDLAHHFGILFEELARAVASLADALPAVTEPGAAFFHNVPRHSQIENIAFTRGALPVNSASRNGAATLFFTTLTRVRLPMTVSPSLIAAIRRMSNLIEA